MMGSGMGMGQGMMQNMMGSGMGMMSGQSGSFLGSLFSFILNGLILLATLALFIGIAGFSYKYIKTNFLNKTPKKDLSQEVIVVENK